MSSETPFKPFQCKDNWVGSDYVFPSPTGPATFKVGKGFQPMPEIADLIGYMYDHDLYMQGKGLIPRPAHAGTDLPKELNISGTKVFFLVGKYLYNFIYIDSFDLVLQV